MRQDLLLGQHPKTNSPSPFMNNVKSAMLADIPLDSSCHEFQQQVAGSCGVEADLQQFKAGFPPKKLDMQGQTIAELGISHGETLILERGTATRTIQSVHTSPADATPSSTSAALPSTADVAGRMPDGRCDSHGDSSVAPCRVIFCMTWLACVQMGCWPNCLLKRCLLRTHVGQWYEE